MSRKITEEYNGFEFKYPQILALTKRQLEDQLWFSSEYDVKLDELEFRFDLSDNEKHFVLKTLPLFIRYEVYVGNFWVDVYAKHFKAPECQELASVINMVERAIHARFYRQISEVLRLDTDDHYTDWKNHEELRERDKYLSKWLKEGTPDQQMLAYSLIEGVGLFSNFLGFRSFQLNGRNKLVVTSKGTIQSSSDEDLHSEALTTSLLIKWQEIGFAFEGSELHQWFIELIKYFVERENIIVRGSMLADELNGVTIQDMQDYIKHRCNVVLERLGCQLLYDVKSRVAEQFDNAVTGYKLTDFFTKGVGSEYTSGWSEQSFVDCIMKGD